MKIQSSAQVRRIMEPGIKKGTKLVILIEKPTCLLVFYKVMKYYTHTVNIQLKHTVWIREEMASMG